MLSAMRTPSAMEAVLPESAYRLSLYTRPEHPFQLHDRVEVTDGLGHIYHGRTSDSFCYPTHCVTVVEVYEVTGASDESHVSLVQSAGEVTA